MAATPANIMAGKITLIDNHIQSTVFVVSGSVLPGHQVLNSSKRPTQPASEISIIQYICCLMSMSLAVNMVVPSEKCNGCYSLEYLK